MSKYLPIFLIILSGFLPVISFAEEAVSEEKVLIQDFVKGSFHEIKKERKGKPFIISFWSIDCTYCFKEMEMFSSLKKKYPDLDVVLVSTDINLDEQVVYMVLDVTGFETEETWVFAEDFPARLYADVDRNWRGELPNTLFLNSKHEFQSVIGEIKPELVEKWLRYIKQEQS